MSIQKPVSEKEKLDAILSRAVPSQLPTYVSRASYNRMLQHCHTDDFRGLWCCSKTNARILAKMNYRTVWNRDNTLSAAHVPIAVLYCSGCDKPPQVKGEDPIFADEVQTVCL